ncbi:hypothetical protein [Dyadobacter psychrophilus]|uniref:Uncharacterized protein n=1 Tax=Dyadobacter psychrophilus TaxID=651661 RepID=A0A1T5FNY9_9BACT|nr:hypothetical protein [Dyadobacter psychrophilus]SKB97827.1 hypothetical protein SAMN05660293_03253 [Dyadobacter psychrophilus]
MSSSSALFQILYQNETLFRVGGIVAPDVVETPMVGEPQSAPATPELPQVAAKAIPATPVIKPVLTPAPALPVADFPALLHRVLILIDAPKQKEMAESESLFLDNILKAVGHSVEKADVLNYSFLKGPDARKVLSEKKTNFFITFGVPLIKLHLDLLLMPYTPKLVDGVWFLLTDSLATIEADRNLKKKLWQALQKMFEMS